MDEAFHLSYPQVFKHKEEIYMLPETKGSNNILLYKAKQFPYSWHISDTLIREKGFKDPFLLLSEDLNLIVAVDDDMKQYMFSADSLKGEWSEVKNYRQNWGNETRLGGRFFNVDNSWYLPLQNMSAGYGTGISFYMLDTKGKNLDLTLAEKLYLEPQSEIE